MKKFLVLITTLFLLMVPLQTSFADEAKTQEKDEYLVQFDGPAKKGLLKAFGVQSQDIVHEFNQLPVYNVTLTEKQAKGLKNNPQIKHVEENAEAQSFAQEAPWGIPHVQGTEAQNNGHTGEGVKVAILDSGVDASHEDLNVAGGYSVLVIHLITMVMATGRMLLVQSLPSIII
ncbi:protease inhibitor I9 family protein [Piscibacillus salipiscarius]|uniref:protease inhibitor I9 family protein n=1 Tax=Piscibacillus salipiscarius TaxID=299480 RepID=UPI0034E19B67